MGKSGHCVDPSEGAIEEHVEGGGGQPLFAADDVGDFHQVVVHNVGQVIGGELVGTLVEHFVVEDGGIDDDIAADDVVDVDVLTRFYFEAHHILVAAGNAGFHLGRIERERVGHHAARRGVVLEVGDLFALLVELFGGVESDVGFSFGQKLVDIFLVDVAAFALAVRAFVATESHPFVKVDAEPAEGLDDVFLCTGHKAVGVGVFDAENEFAAVLAGKEVVIECCAHSTDVERAGGRGCETHANVAC